MTPTARELAAALRYFHLMAIEGGQGDDLSYPAGRALERMRGAVVELERLRGDPMDEEALLLIGLLAVAAILFSMGLLCGLAARLAVV